MPSTLLSPIITGGALAGRLFAQLLGENQTSTEHFSEGVAPGCFIGPYMLEEIVGQGGGGVVFRAVRNDGHYATHVAIKILRPDTAQSDEVFRECQMLAQISHPTVPKIHDAGVLASGERWFAMELVCGVPIDDYFASNRGHFQARLAAVRNLCDGLAAAHEAGIVHRDIKPSNVLIDIKGRVRLIDFGVAVEPARGVGSASPRAMTLLWASPEQLAGVPVSCASDVYQLGLLVQRLMCEQPVSSARWRETLRTRNLAAVAHRATAEHPQARYPNALAMALDLERVAAGVPAQALPWRWSERLLFVMARHMRRVLLLSVLGLAAILYVWNDRDADLASVERTNAALAFVNGLVDQANPVQQGGRRKSAVSVLDQAADLLKRNAGLSPDDQLSLASRIVDLYVHLDEPEAGAELARSVVASIDPAQSQCRFCYFKLMLGEARALDEADQLDASAATLDAAEKFSETLGEDERAVAKDVLAVARANLFVMRGEFKHADVLLTPVLARPFPPDPLRQEYLILAHNLRGFTLGYSDTAKELEHFTRAHEIAQRLLGPRHRWTLTSAELMAVTISEAGDHVRAIELLERIRHEAEEYLLRDGTIHPVLSHIETTLAHVHQRRGDNEAALASIGSSIDRLLAYDPESVDLAPRLIVRGRAQKAIGSLAEALEDFLRAAALAEKSIGSRGPHMLLTALSEAARAQLGLGLAGQAMATADEIEETLLGLNSTEPSWAASALITIAKVRAANAQVVPALAVLDRSRPFIAALEGPQRADYERQIDATVASIYQQGGDGRAALEAIDAAIAQLQQEAPGSAALASRFLTRGQLRRDAGQLEAALEDFFGCAELAGQSAEVVGPYTLLTAQTEAVRILLRLGRTGHAARIAQEMEELIRDMESPDPTWHSSVLITAASVRLANSDPVAARRKLDRAQLVLDKLAADNPQRKRYEGQIAELRAQRRGND